MHFWCNNFLGLDTFPQMQTFACISSVKVLSRSELTAFSLSSSATHLHNENTSRSFDSKYITLKIYKKIDNRAKLMLLFV